MGVREHAASLSVVVTTSCIAVVYAYRFRALGMFCNKYNKDPT